MNKRHATIIATTIAAMAAVAACSPGTPSAAEPGVQVYPNSATSRSTVVREITTISGRQCVMVQGYKEAAITCDWSRK